jgi:hypothetical protein
LLVVVAVVTTTAVAAVLGAQEQAQFQHPNKVILFLLAAAVQVALLVVL